MARSGEAKSGLCNMRMMAAEDEKREALEKIVVDLGKLQGLAKTNGETFVAFLIASAQREAGARCAEMMSEREPR